jgi:hypothetical protein
VRDSTLSAKRAELPWLESLAEIRGEPNALVHSDPDYWAAFQFIGA